MRKEIQICYSELYFQNHDYMLLFNLQIEWPQKSPTLPYMRSEVTAVNNMIMVLWDITCCGLVDRHQSAAYTQKMEAVCSSEMLVPVYHTTRCKMLHLTGPYSQSSCCSTFDITAKALSTTCGYSCSRCVHLFRLGRFAST